MTLDATEEQCVCGIPNCQASQESDGDSDA